MKTILGFLSLALFIAFIVGLVKPALVLRWSNKPTRLKVFGYWILASFLVGILAVATESDEDSAESSIEADNNYIEQESQKNEKLSKLEIEASRLRAGGSVKTVELEGKSARISYVKNYEEYKELNPQSGLTESDLEGYWESGDAIKKALVDGSVRIMKKLDYIDTVLITLPYKGATYTISVNKTVLEKFVGADFSTIQNNWDETFSNPYVYNDNGRNSFFNKFGKKE